MLYLAYRSGYFPNCRYIKEFEEESILNWFQRYWDKFTTENPEEDDDYVKVLGTHIYGFSIWQVDDEPIPSSPTNFEELISIIGKYIYNNEIEGDENCLKVLTDDDEIELAWFLFTEKYKQENFDNLSLWFCNQLPIRYGENGLKLNVEIEILPQGNKEGCVYFISCPIYDGANLEDLEGAYKIENIRLPDLITYLKENEFEDSGYEYDAGYSELEFLQYISRGSENINVETLFNIFSKIPITELNVNQDGTNQYEGCTIDELLGLDLRNDAKKSIVNASEHICEISINTVGEFYNYWIIFDDLWVEENEKLAKSILCFGKDWKI